MQILNIRWQTTIASAVAGLLRATEMVGSLEVAVAGVLIVMHRPNGGRGRGSVCHSALENQMTCAGHLFSDRSLAGLSFFTSAWIFFMLLLSRVCGHHKAEMPTPISSSAFLFGSPMS